MATAKKIANLGDEEKLRKIITYFQTSSDKFSVFSDVFKFLPPNKIQIKKGREEERRKG